MWDNVLLRPLGSQTENGRKEGKCAHCTGFRYGWTQGLVWGPYLSFLSLPGPQVSALVSCTPRQVLPEVGLPASALGLSDLGPVALPAPWQQPRGTRVCHIHTSCHHAKTWKWDHLPQLHRRKQRAEGPEVESEGATDAAQV